MLGDNCLDLAIVIEHANLAATEFCARSGVANLRPLLRVGDSSPAERPVLQNTAASRRDVGTSLSPNSWLTTIKAHEIVHRRYKVLRPRLMARHFGRMRFSNRPVRTRGSSNERQQ